MAYDPSGLWDISGKYGETPHCVRARMEGVVDTAAECRTAYTDDTTPRCPLLTAAHEFMG